MGIYFKDKRGNISNLRGRTVTMPANIKRFMDIYDEDNPPNLNYQKGGVHYFIPLISALNRPLVSDLGVCVKGSARYAVDAYARNSLALTSLPPRGGEITVYLFMTAESTTSATYRLYIRCYGYNGKTTIPITVNWTDITGANRTTTFAVDTAISNSVTVTGKTLYYVAQMSALSSKGGDHSKINIRSVKIGDWNTYTFPTSEKYNFDDIAWYKVARHSFSISDLTSSVDS